jgi:hypothetical protein
MCAAVDDNAIDRGPFATHPAEALKVGGLAMTNASPDQKCAVRPFAD